MTASPAPSEGLDATDDALIVPSASSLAANVPDTRRPSHGGWESPAEASCEARRSPSWTKGPLSLPRKLLMHSSDHLPAVRVKPNLRHNGPQPPRQLPLPLGWAFLHLIQRPTTRSTRPLAGRQLRRIYPICRMACRGQWTCQIPRHGPACLLHHRR